MTPTTLFSPCRTYRYSLWRHWGGEGYAMFIGLNPSTADEIQDDPTVRRCIGFAKDWGFGGLCMTNLFAFRATDPQDMKKAIDPIGPENDRALLDLAEHAGVIVAAWGTHGTFRGRDRTVIKLIPRLSYLRLTKDQHPAHPLYLPKTLSPVAWNHATPTTNFEGDTK